MSVYTEATGPASNRSTRVLVEEPNGIDDGQTWEWWCSLGRLRNCVIENRDILWMDFCDHGLELPNDRVVYCVSKLLIGVNANGRAVLEIVFSPKK